MPHSPGQTLSPSKPQGTSAAGAGPEFSVPASRRMGRNPHDGEAGRGYLCGACTWGTRHLSPVSCYRPALPLARDSTSLEEIRGCTVADSQAQPPATTQVEKFIAQFSSWPAGSGKMEHVPLPGLLSPVQGSTTPLGGSERKELWCHFNLATRPPAHDPPFLSIKAASSRKCSRGTLSALLLILPGKSSVTSCPVPPDPLGP